MNKKFTCTQCKKAKDMDSFLRLGGATYYPVCKRCMNIKDLTKDEKPQDRS
jgi:hypothetical protein